MDKFKKFYKEHRIFVILMGIVTVCAIIMIIFLLRFFYFGVGSAPKRTCVDIAEGTKGNIVSKFQGDKLVKDIDIETGAKSNIAFVTVRFNEKASLVEAQSQAVKVLEEFNEEEKNCYNIQFTIIQDKSKSSDGFTLMGSVNINGTNIIWSNNNTKSE